MLVLHAKRTVRRGEILHEDDVPVAGGLERRLGRLGKRRDKSAGADLSGAAGKVRVFDHVLVIQDMDDLERAVRRDLHIADRNGNGLVEVDFFSAILNRDIVKSRVRERDRTDRRSRIVRSGLGGIRRGGVVGGPPVAPEPPEEGIVRERGLIGEGIVDLLSLQDGAIGETAAHGDAALIQGADGRGVITGCGEDRRDGEEQNKAQNRRKDPYFFHGVAPPLLKLC